MIEVYINRNSGRWSKRLLVNKAISELKYR